jgi:SAM-dependent methyltransferase
MPEMDERHRDEIRRHGRNWRPPEREVSEAMIPWNMRPYQRVLERLFPAPEGVRGRDVLDCGCGHGILSILLARRGARVRAFDITPEVVERARELARANSVDRSIEFAEGAVENLPYASATFDAVMGTRILHHVEIAPAAREIWRVLKPGGRAVFWEPTCRDPFMRCLRSIYRRIPLIPRAGTEFEHPLTRQEVDTLSATFGGNLEQHGAPFFFFSHVLLVTGLRRVKLLRQIGTALDRGIDAVFPVYRRWSYHQILVLTKNP